MANRPGARAIRMAAQQSSERLAGITSAATGRGGGFSAYAELHRQRHAMERFAIGRFCWYLPRPARSPWPAMVSKSTEGAQTRA